MSNSGAVFDNALIQPPGMTNASIAGVPFRINPDTVQLSFDVKSSTTPTLGGLVVQVFGVEYSDLVVSGSFGVGGYDEQALFLERIGTIAYNQSPAMGTNAISNPVRFLFPLLNYDFMVFIKDYTSPQGEAIVFDNKNINPQYTLTMFIATDNSPLSNQKVAADAYLTRLASGLGYKNVINEFNGPQTSTAAQALITAAGGTLADFSKQFFGGPASTATTSGGSPAASTSGNTTAPSLTGGSNEAKVWNYFKAKGLSNAAVAGMMGNFQAESSFSPTANQNGGNAATTPINTVGFGLAQWTFTSRQDPLVALAKQEGVAPNTLGVQCDYVWQELTSNYASTLAAIKAATTATDAANVFGKQYEGYGTDTAALRASYAEAIYKAYAK